MNPFSVNCKIRHDLVNLDYVLKFPNKLQNIMDLCIFNLSTTPHIIKTSHGPIVKSNSTHIGT